MKQFNTGESSKGRKPDSDSVNVGSSPALPANYYWCHIHNLDTRSDEDHRLHEKDCKHFRGTHFYDNPHRYMCVDCGKQIVDCGNGYE